jgi:hypothetical protein
LAISHRHRFKQIPCQKADHEISILKLLIFPGMGKGTGKGFHPQDPEFNGVKTWRQGRMKYWL